MASGLRGQLHLSRLLGSLLGRGSGRRDIAREAAEEVEHALAPGAQRVFGSEHFLRAHDARPLEHREQDVIGVRRLAAADVGLPLERCLHWLEGAAEALQRVVALGARLLERLPEDLLEHLAHEGVVARVDPLVDVGDDHRQHRRHHRPVDPGVEGLRHAAADGAAEQGRRLRIGILEMLGDLPGIAYYRLGVLDRRNRLAAGEGNGCLVAHAHRLRLEREPFVHEGHARAPREQAVAPAALPAELPEGDHAAFLLSLTSCVAGRERTRRSICSARSRGALRNAWSRPERYCGGQNCGRCWYQAEACSVKYGLARCGRASATRSALPEASSVLTWSAVVTAPTVMVAMPTSLRTQSENGAWYMRPYTGRWCGTVWPVEQSIMSQPAAFSMRAAAIRASPDRPPGAQSVAEMRTDMGFF